MLKKAKTAFQNHRIPIVFHVDGTFKLNETEYPLIIIGITDAAQQMHPLAFFTVSQRTTSVYTTVLRAFKAHLLAAGVTDENFTPHYVMADAETAENNAFKAEYPHALYLMCYFHVKQNVISRFAGNEHELKGK